MEMNMHMPQNILAETELRNLAAIPYQIVSPTKNSPIIGIFQDSLLGSFRLTRKNIKFTPREAMNLLMSFANVDTKTLRELDTNINSFDILSQIIPPLTLSYKTKLFEDDEDYATSNNVLDIRNGKYLRGQIEKSVFGTATKGILHRINNDYGKDACVKFIDDLQNIVTSYMNSSAFSVGISDLIANKETQDSIINVITSQKIEVQEYMNKIHLGIFDNSTANSNNMEFETTVNNLLNKASEKSGAIGRKSLSKDNRFVMIVNSGSKGSPLNIAQMISCLGQQNVDGKRIPYGFDSRTLPHYSKFDDSPNARGFIENSYTSGLTAPELFFHAMGGRIGLIDTACKTSTTGYIQRRLIKALEDVKVEYDMTVRNNKGKIIQFAYGDDNFDSTKIENQKLPLVSASIEDIYAMYDLIGMNEQDEGVLNVYTKPTATRMRKQKQQTLEKCKSYIDKMIIMRDDIVDKIFKNKNENEIRIPVAFQNIIANIQGQLYLTDNSFVDITPLEAFEMFEDYYAKLEKLNYIKPNELFHTFYNYYLTPKDLLIKKRFNKKALVLLLETVTLKYKQSIVHPGEMVGVVAGQSLGEPSTQLTLNSVTFETEIVVKNALGAISKVKIGEFTEQQTKLSQKIDYIKDKDTTYAELQDYYEIPCSTENGETVWRRIEAVTQHPVQNEDGTNTMLKVITKRNREVIATKAKSFLQLIDGKIQGVNGKDLKVGDYIPCSIKPLEYKESNMLDLREFLPPTEYLYGSELAKANALRGERHWWKNHANKSFILPHSSSQSLSSLFRENAGKGKTPNKSQYILAGNVYMKSMGCSNYTIPEKIELDYEFGYLLGAYASEGCSTKNDISIANINDDYLLPIEKLCDKWNIPHKKHKRENRGGEGWTSQELKIYNTILSRIMEHLCGKLSYNKFVSPKIVFSNRECILGFLDAYIGGDGSIEMQKNKNGTTRIYGIHMWSTSHTLLTDVMVMLRNLGVSATINKIKPRKPTDRVIQNRRTSYSLDITNNQSKKLASLLHIPIQYKQDRINEILNQDYLHEHSKFDDEVLPNIVNDELQLEQRNGRMMDLCFDEIVSIEEVPNTTPYAYDLTVEDTRNFDCYNGISVRDTFHNSGVGSKSNVTRGVPRIEELLRLTKNPKNPSLTIFLKPLDEQNKDRATKFANMITHTKLIDVVKTMQIIFEPNERETTVMEDQLLLDQFNEFENMIEECLPKKTDPQQIPQKSKWIVRMEIDEELLLDKNITMDDINFAIKSSPVGSEINCVFSDYNDGNLVFRIRLNSDIFDKSKKKEKGVAFSLDQSNEIYLLKNFQDTLLNNIVLRGTNRIQNAMPRKLQNSVVKEGGKFIGKDTWIIDTTGSNLLQILALDYIDYTRTYSNDIREIFDVLGIEAARQSIYEEFVEVMSFSGVYINYHHLSLLCDRMTSTKDMVAIFRSGLLRDDVGVLSKASFEVHTEVLLNASRFAEFDHMRGVSANIMTGQDGLYGTGSFNLVLDMNAMNTLKNADIIDNNKNEIEKLFGDVEDKENSCGQGKIAIRNNIATIKELNDDECINDDFKLDF